MEKDILRLMEEVDLSNDHDIRCVRWVITILRAALLTGTAPELVGVVTDFARGKTLEMLEEIAVEKNDRYQAVG